MAEHHSPAAVVNRPPSGIEFPDVAALWRDRELFYFLAWRDVRVRYKQTALGAAWVVLQPVATMLIFTFVFGRVDGLAPAGVPYSAFVYAALVPWTFFSSAVTQAAQSLVLQERILTRVHFPRILIPMAAIAAVLVDLAVTLPVLGILLAFHGITPGWALLALPVWVLLVVLVAVAVGPWLGAINVRYRDVRYITPFLVQIWFFVTPIVYDTSVVPERWRIVLELNPLVGIVDGFRWSALGTDAPGRSLVIAVIVIVVGTTVSLFHFRRLEATFADEV